MALGDLLAVIPARGGSKGLPHKNLLEAGGLPLLAWTIRVAQACRGITRLVLSTDDPQIAAIARAEGCEVPFMRPPELATDTATSAAVLVHAIEQLGGPERWDGVLLLQPTSPLRRVDDLDQALAIYASSRPRTSVISVCELDCPLPLQYGLNPDQTLRRLHPTAPTISRRQDAEPIYRPNGAIYIVPPGPFLEHQRFVDQATRALVMPPERSLDIDAPLDLEWLRFRCAQDPTLVPPRTAPLPEVG